MRVWQISSFGIDSLEFVERPNPEPGPGQVLVRIHAISLNFRDLLMVKGIYNPRLRLPRIPCSDGAGEVLRVGAGVTTWSPGDRVAGIFMQNWVDGPPTPAKVRGALGGDIDGTLAEYIVLNETGLVAIPDHLSYQEAATLPCAAVTAWNALCAGDVKPGGTVLIQGTGGVSIFALQFARMMGCTVIATSSSDEKLARAKKLGAAHGINYKTTPDWDKAAVEITGGRGVDQVVEVGGAGTVAKSLGAIRQNGRVSMIGVLTGASDFNPMMILGKRANVQGISVGSTQMFEAMNRAIAANAMKPVIDKVFPFQDTKAAFKHLQSAQHFGKIVISMS